MLRNTQGPLRPQIQVCLSARYKFSKRDTRGLNSAVSFLLWAVFVVRDQTDKSAHLGSLVFELCYLQDKSFLFQPTQQAASTKDKDKKNKI